MWTISLQNDWLLHDEERQSELAFNTQNLHTRTFLLVWIKWKLINNWGRYMLVAKSLSLTNFLKTQKNVKSDLTKWPITPWWKQITNNFFHYSSSTDGYLSVEMNIKKIRLTNNRDMELSKQPTLTILVKMHIHVDGTLGNWLITPWCKEILKFCFQYSQFTDSYRSGDINIIRIHPQTTEIQSFENDQF